jgi:CHASE3 domain sensor protein
MESMLMIIVALAALSLSSCSAVRDTIDHVGGQGRELVDYSTEKVEGLANQVAERMDNSIKKAAQEIGTAIKELLDSEIVAFTAVSIVLLLLVWIVSWVLLQLRRN